MQIRKFGLSAVMVSLALSGCNSPGLIGPPRPVRLAHIDGGLGAGQFICDPDGNFTGPASSAQSIASNNLGWSFSARVCTSMRNPNDAGAAVDMLDSGFTLVKVRCNDFFAVKAQRQTGSQLIRSLIQPLTTAVVSTFAVVNFGSEQRESDALALLAMGSALTGSVIDIYEEQFLFDADNIDAVRGLTMRALDAHRQEVLARNPSGFDPAVRQLTDHQMICTPASILSLVRNAIDDGEIQPRQRIQEPILDVQEDAPEGAEQVSLEPA